MTAQSLSVEKINAIVPEGDKKIIVHDGHGLYLSSQRTKAGGIGRSWIFRYSLKVKVTSANGREYRAQRQIGLGAYPGVSIDAARELRREAAVLARQGIDPREEWDRRAALVHAGKEAPKPRFVIRRRDGTERTIIGAPTFMVAQVEYVYRKGSAWSVGQAMQWAQIMRDHVLPVLGEVGVDAIDVHAVRRVLDPLWAPKSEGGAPDTASRTRAHIEAVIDFASFEGWRGNPAPANPARWKGSLEHAYPPIAELKEDRNHDAVDPFQAAVFMAEVRKLEGHDARALEMLALTAVRTGSILQATWGQIDRAGRVWAIPTTKTDQPQWVPLTDQMLRCLDAVKPTEVAPDTRIFNIDRNAMYQCCQKVARKLKVKATPHGWRATFKTAAGLTGQDTVLTEAALSHAIGTEVCRRYDRATVHRNLLKQRRPLMAWWCGVLDGIPLSDPEDGEIGNVIPLTRVA